MYTRCGCQSSCMQALNVDAPVWRHLIMSMTLGPVLMRWAKIYSKRWRSSTANSSKDVISPCRARGYRNKPSANHIQQILEAKQSPALSSTNSSCRPIFDWRHWRRTDLTNLSFLAHRSLSRSSTSVDFLAIFRAHTLHLLCIGGSFLFCRSLLYTKITSGSSVKDLDVENLPLRFGDLSYLCCPIARAN